MDEDTENSNQSLFPPDSLLTAVNDKRSTSDVQFMKNSHANPQ